MDIQKLPAQFFNFIKSHSNSDTSLLRLKFHNKESEFDMGFALTQIECRKRFGKKLSTFISNDRFLFPSSLAGEQASHEAVAKYHSSLFGSHEKVLDMTAGLGIDSIAIAGNADLVTSCEIDETKAECLRHNISVLGISNLKVINSDSVEIINSRSFDSFDTVFIDPARRDSGNERVYNFHDCQPDILKLQEYILFAGKRLVIKGSPLLDISQTLIDFPSTTAIRSVSVDGECKEILVEAEKRGSLQTIEAVSLDRSGKIIYDFKYTPSEESGEVAYAEYSDIRNGSFLYEPDAGIMKLAPWNILSSRFNGLKKFGKSTHLFVSDSYHKGFPGRIMRIERILEKNDRKNLKGLPVNVATRNYPMSAIELRKKLKVKEGLDSFVYGSRIGDDTILILAERL